MQHLKERRQRLQNALQAKPALIFAGLPRPRNYAANVFAFHASSHFIYLTGQSIPGAALLLTQDRARLFVHKPTVADALWHGPPPSSDQLAKDTGCEICWLEDLPGELSSLAPATLPTPDLLGCEQLSSWLGRPVRPGALPSQDEELADALIASRLQHDEASVRETRKALALTAASFKAGMEATAPGVPEQSIRAIMEYPLLQGGTTYAYGPIISVHGEVLHNETHSNVMREGDLLLVDFGAQSSEGWASDITRTWPVSGKFSSTQKEIYEVVLAAEKAAIEACVPGARYRDIHMATCRAMTAGLVDLGIFSGDPDELVADNAHTLFFPHGLGHLLGLDVHDMEDLGDRAGYAPGRTRSDAFGTAYLRMDRDLTPGMMLTIEPGFYQVPAILNDPKLLAMAGDRLNKDVLAHYKDVRGIRIEDDVLVTANGPENLSADIPKDVADLEAIIGTKCQQ